MLTDAHPQESRGKNPHPENCVCVKPIKMLLQNLGCRHGCCGNRFASAFLAELETRDQHVCKQDLGQTGLSSAVSGLQPISSDSGKHHILCLHCLMYLMLPYFKLTNLNGIHDCIFR